MSKNQLRIARRVVSVLTATATAVTIGGSAFIGLAAVPADFGLREGDTISANAQAGDPDVYIVNDHGYKRLFVNPAIFGLYGHLSFAGVKQVSAATRDAFPTSGLFRNCETGDQRVWGLDVISEDVANLRWVNTSGAQAVADDPNFFKKVFCINNNEVALYGTGPDYNSVNDVRDYNRDGGPAAPVVGFNPNGGTQGAIKDESVGSPDKDTVMEGQKNVEVWVADIETENDGPLLLQSVDVWFANTSGGGGASLKPWEVFTDVRLTLDGKTLATMDADSTADWSDKFTACDHVVVCDSFEYRMRFSGLSGVLPNDDTIPLGIEVSAMNTFDSDDIGETWEIDLGDHRVLDESGFVDTVEGDEFTDLDQDFDLDEADIAKIDAVEAADNVDASVNEVSDTADTNGIPVFAFTLEEKNDVGVDIEDFDFTFTVSDTMTGDDEAAVIRRAKLYEGNTLLGTETVPTGGAVTFENTAAHLNPGQKKDYTVKVDVKDTDSQARYEDGTKVEVSLDDLPTLNDENGNDETDIDPIGGLPLTSEEQELRESGLNLELLSTSAVKSAGSAPDDDTGTYTIKVRATAFGADQYVSNSCGDGGFDTNISISSAASFTDCSLTSTAVLSGGTYRIADGTSQDLTITVVATGTGTGSLNHVNLDDLGYDEISGSGDDFSYDFNLDDYQTDDIFIRAN